MAESTKNLVPRFFNKTALSYDKIVNRTTFGKDKYWKKEILKFRHAPIEAPRAHRAELAFEPRLHPTEPGRFDEDHQMIGEAHP